MHAAFSHSTLPDSFAVLISKRFVVLLALVLAALTLHVSCGSNSTVSSGPSISGTVSAPAGMAASFARPASPWRMFARLVDRNVRYLRTYWRTRPAGRVVADLAISDVRSVRTWWRTVSVPRLVASLFVPDVMAAVTVPGLVPVAGVQVELVELDNSGNPLVVLAEGVTDSSGNSQDHLCGRVPRMQTHAHRRGSGREQRR